MVNLTKSQTIPSCLEKEKLKANGDYKCGQVLPLLVKEFHNKCYICEQKGITSINVEHFKPHRGNKELKFDWQNLFLACAHCNNTKLDKYDNILSCIDPNEDVENWIKYEMKLFAKEQVKLKALREDIKTQDTVKLLNAVYNGTTHLKNLEASNIRDAILRELLDFQQAINGFYDEEAEEDEKSVFEKKIRKHLKKTTAFTAFKRWIIKDNALLLREFKKYLD